MVLKQNTVNRFLLTSIGKPATMPLFLLRRLKVDIHRDSIMQTLKGVFGFDTFLPTQERVVSHLLDGKHTLAVMPTGSGKSLCYQLPALLMPNISIVVSPMISLMNDQVRQMRLLGVPAAMYHSGLDAVEKGAVLTRLEADDLKLLYVAPETLVKEGFLQNINPDKVDLLAVDEAHCISIWGHDFRPEYRLLASLAERFPRAVRFASTATATPKVRKDICSILDIPADYQIVESFDRRNLMLTVEQKQNGFDKLLNFLTDHPNESGLIYCLTRKGVDSLADKLQRQGYSVLPYHAGLSDMERSGNQELFVRDEARIIVATIAFGMGINKPNIRYVVHYDLPKNIETYYQEIGRGGRDGLPCVCMLMFSWSDVRKVKAVINLNDSPNRREMYNRHLQALLGYIDTSLCRRIPLLNWFGEKHEISNCGMCDNCLKHDIEWVDATIPAQKFLSAAVRSREIFGAGHLIDILRGSENKQIKRFKHEELSVYGIGKDWSREDWFGLFAQLRQNRLLDVDPEHGSIVLNEKSWKVLRNELDVRVPKEAVAVLIQSPCSECDLSLLELLDKERVAIARRIAMPPYMIASDKALREMASFYPQSMESLAGTTGLGTKVIAEYGDRFLRVIMSFCERNKIAEIARPEKEPRTKPKKSKSALVGEFLALGNSIHMAMIEFDLTREVILRHVNAFLEEGGLLDPVILLNSSLLEDDQVEKAIETFRRLGTGYISPVQQVLGDEYTYQELFIIQLYLLAKARIDGNHIEP